MKCPACKTKMDQEGSRWECPGCGKKKGEPRKKRRRKKRNPK